MSVSNEKDKSKEAKLYTCQICGKEKPFEEVMSGEMVRNPIVRLIRKEGYSWSPKEHICLEDLDEFRNKYAEQIIKEEKGELNKLDREVLRSLKKHELVSKDASKEFEKKLTFGERLSDKIADFGGSWKFIMIFLFVLIGWMILNTLILMKKAFDPFPFILLNLFLSTLAAIQAPIIMMSQNRQEDRDRLRSEYDYKINMKAELEIRHLHEKIDQLTKHQWRRLLEIQQIQLDLIKGDQLKKKKEKLEGLVNP